MKANPVFYTLISLALLGSSGVIDRAEAIVEPKKTSGSEFPRVTLHGKYSIVLHDFLQEGVMKPLVSEH